MMTWNHHRKLVTMTPRKNQLQLNWNASYARVLSKIPKLSGCVVLFANCYSGVLLIGPSNNRLWECNPTQHRQRRWCSLVASQISCVPQHPSSCLLGFHGSQRIRPRILCAAHGVRLQGTSAITAQLGVPDQTTIPHRSARLHLSICQRKPATSHHQKRNN